jgi:hypothetical protein
MAKQVQILIICDFCKKRWADGDEQAPVERDWSWNGSDYLVELCAECLELIREEVLKPLFEASEQKKRRGPGRPPGAPNKTKREQMKRERPLPRGSFDKYKDEDGLYICPVKDCGRPFEFPQHLGNHHAKTHGSLLD